jgi:hypothetical protein
MICVLKKFDQKPPQITVDIDGNSRPKSNSLLRRKAERNSQLSQKERRGVKGHKPTPHRQHNNDNHRPGVINQPKTSTHTFPPPAPSPNHTLSPKADNHGRERYAK